MSSTPLDKLFSSAGEVSDLRPGDIHVWVFSTDLPSRDQHTLESNLSPEEILQFSRLVDCRQGLLRSAARGWLKHILAVYTGLPAANLSFDRNPYGKPAIRHEQNLIGIEFNLSHSGRLGALVICLQRQAGIDIEMHVPLDTIQHIRTALPDSGIDYVDAGKLLDAWTEREAVLKARGCGWKGSSLADDDQHWPVQRFTPSEGYSGAICVEGGFARENLTIFDIVSK